MRDFLEQPLACLLTGIMFLEGKAELLEGEDGAIIIPKAI
jgi:hypothetical protein